MINPVLASIFLIIDTWSSTQLVIRYCPISSRNNR